MNGQALPVRFEILGFFEIKAVSPSHLVDPPKAHMGVLVAQELQRMRREIDDHQPRRLAVCQLWVAEIGVEHLVHCHQIVGVALACACNMLPWRT